MKNPRFMTILAMILLSAAMRLVPHWPNFTPVAAMALFAGASFNRTKTAFLIPIISLFLSDLFLGFHPVMPFVYGSVFLTVLIGRFVKNKGALAITGASLSSSMLFFLVTNFGHWAMTAMYPKTMEGLMLSYAAGLPFYRYSFMGDLFYTGCLFGVFALAQRRFPILQSQSSLA